MKKLLFVISQLYKGGAETSLVNLLNNLDYNKYEVDLVILNQEPVENAVSLIDRVNKNVNVCDAYAEYQKITILDRIRAKLIYSSEQKFAFWFPALDFVRHKVYDWAFFVGEWCSPAFVAYHTNAKVKAAWIHSDLSKTQNFDDELYFYFYDCFDYYIFVSNNSLEESVKKYPFLKNKAITIYNIVDAKYIKNRAEEQLDDYIFDKNIPTLLTCANFRPEKNHMRQVEVLFELKKRGITVNWVNIGSTVDKRLVEEVRNFAQKEGISSNFIMLGPKKNPYNYMKHADAVTVLSDYESWSMVITEAKILGIPVISTKTAGALEQIEHKKTGILTEFDANNIADEIEIFLRQPEVSKTIRHNLDHFDNTFEIIKSFNKLLSTDHSHVINNCNSNILYVIDDINYKGGAHSATKRQIMEIIKQGNIITIFSNIVPNIEIRNELKGAKFISCRNLKEDMIYNRRYLECITNRTFSMSEKGFKNKLIFKNRILNNDKIYDEYVISHLSELFSEYDIVCVMSEGSNFRKMVSESKCKKKIQWIHTDYVVWTEQNDWTRSITKNDEKIYSKFDYIILLSETICNKFNERFPDLRKKTLVIKNLIPIHDIINKSKIKEKYFPSVHFVSIGRLSFEKAYERLINVLGKLYDEGYQFIWDIVGDGDLKESLKNLIIKKGLEKNVFLLGYRENPYKYISNAQVFALLSTYEGMPNTIFESLILGVPVLSTNVGGICEQVIQSETGWIVENDIESIYNGIKYILEHQEEIDIIKSKLIDYKYDNQEIFNQVVKIFDLEVN